MNSKKFFGLILLVLSFAVVNETVSGQVNMQRVGLYQYAQYDGTWYTVVDGKQGDQVDTRHLIVRLKDKAEIDRFDFSIVDLPCMRNVRGEFADGFYELEISDGLDGFEAARRLEGTGRFDEVLFNIFIKVNADPNDQYYGSQWNLPKVSMSSGWDLGTGDPAIIVAVIDVGADYDHEDLAGNRWSDIGYDFYDDDDDPYPSDEAHHGTAVAGILGAVTNNSIGVAGVAGGWGGVDGIRIMHLDAGWRDANGDEWIDLAASVQAIDSAAAWGARVINMSFGSEYGYSAWQSAINSAVNNYDVVCVASAGNYGQGEPTSVFYPAKYSNTIAVGATTPSDYRKELNDGTEWWWGSCYGPELEVMAPGVYIYTTDITGSIGYSSGNYYSSFNGTSSAAPHVAGLAALIRSINPSLTWQQVRDILRNSADKVPGMGGQNFHNEYGYGRINTLRSVANAFISANPEYTFVEGIASSFLQQSNVDILFLVRPLPNLSAGWYRCDRHVVDVTLNGYNQTPQGWYLSEAGYSFNNPNDASRWVGITTTSNSITFKTVFYWLKYYGWQTINRWAPFNPYSNYSAKYAVLGIPFTPPTLSVTITGPTHLDPNETGTFTANPDGGSLTYTNYRWWKRWDGAGGGGPENAFAGNKADVAQEPVVPELPPPDVWFHLSYYDGYQTIQQSASVSFSLKCEVTDSEGSTATDIHYIYVPGGGGPPPEVAQQSQTPTLNLVPKELSLMGNYPNPFNPTTTIRFGLPEDQHVKLTVYSVTGEKVITLTDGILQKGFHNVVWNGRNQIETPVATGIYIYELQAGDRRLVKKMLFAK